MSTIGSVHILTHAFFNFSERVKRYEKLLHLLPLPQSRLKSRIPNQTRMMYVWRLTPDILSSPSATLRRLLATLNVHDVHFQKKTI